MYTLSSHWNAQLQHIIYKCAKYNHTEDEDDDEEEEEIRKETEQEMFQIEKTVKAIWH